MHPNAFLNSLWRYETIDQVFVAMSFEPKFTARFEDVIKPAIEVEPIHGRQLTACRVDNSKTGDSILTDIVNGIVHSRFVLADVSVIDEGRYTGTPIRNSNVMYEVGLALACRSPSEVLLIRDDSKKFLFDVSTIPHMEINFADHNAVSMLRTAIADRVAESNLLNDARVQIAARTLTQDELRLLRILAQLEPNQARDLAHKDLGRPSSPDQRGIDGLIHKGGVRSVAENTASGAVLFGLTPFGYALAEVAETVLEKVEPEEDAGQE